MVCVLLPRQLWFSEAAGWSGMTGGVELVCVSQLPSRQFGILPNLSSIKMKKIPGLGSEDESLCKD